MILIVAFFAAGSAGIPTALIVHPVVCHLRRMALLNAEYSTRRLPHKQIPKSACHVRSRTVRSHKYNER